MNVQPTRIKENPVQCLRCPPDFLLAGSSQSHSNLTLRADPPLSTGIDSLRRSLIPLVKALTTALSNSLSHWSKSSRKDSEDRYKREARIRTKSGYSAAYRGCVKEPLCSIWEQESRHAHEKTCKSKVRLDFTSPLATTLTLITGYTCHPLASLQVWMPKV